MNTEFTRLYENLVENNDILQGHSMLSQVSKPNKSGLFCYYLTTDLKECPFNCKSDIKNPIYIIVNKNHTSLACLNKSCVNKKYELKIDAEFVKDNCQEISENLKKRFGQIVELNDRIQKSIEYAMLNMSHYRIAKMCFIIYKDTIRIDNIKNGEWYIFNGTRWEKSNIIDVLISEDIVQYLTLYNEDLQEQKLANPDNNSIQERIKNVSTVMNKLEDVNYKKTIIKQLSILFNVLDPDFYEKLDANENLLGFKNGVYDFTTFTFRQGKPDDYITFSTGHDYTPFDPNGEITKAIYTFLSQIIRERDTLEYVLTILGKSLMGLIDEKFYIFTGIKGANGKSTLITFLEHALGNYMTSIDPSLLTQTRKSSGNASPDVTRLRGKRLFSLPETEHNDKLKTGILKQFTGNDDIVARELYKPSITFKLMGTMLLLCNIKPEIDNFDGGVARRIDVIEFTSVFKDAPNPQNSWEFKKDYSVKYKLKEWKSHFCSLLIHYCKLYHENGNRLEIPRAVLNASRDYKNENNNFLDFFDQCIAFSKESFETFKDISNKFSIWWIENYPGTKVLSSKELKRAFLLKFGKETVKIISGIKYSGYNIKFRDEIEEDSDDEEIVLKCDKKSSDNDL